MWWLRSCSKPVRGPALVAVILASLSTDAASNAAAANALIDAAVQKVAADKGIAVAMPSAGGAAGGAVVDSAALDAFAAKVTGADGVLASTAKFVLNQLGVAAPVAEETADENAAVVAAVEAELGADWPKQVEPRFDERKGHSVRRSLGIRT